MPAKKPPAKRSPRRAEASEEARNGLADVTGRMDKWVGHLKNLVYLLMIVGGMFFGFWNLIGKPFAQQFVSSTVQETIAEVQKNIADLRLSVEEGKATDAETKAKLDMLAAQLQVLQNATETNQDTQREILQTLKERLGPAPAN